MNYAASVDYINKLDKFGIDLGLDRMKLFLTLLGTPQADYPCVHVAGTNGKGSTSLLISRALSLCGRKAGLYTSPQLEEFGERIQINGQSLPHESLAPLLQTILATASSEKMLENLTQFEVITAMAFKHFSNESVDAAVIEVGMGGRLDATNLIFPMASVITNVGMDHIKYLGNSIAAIAREKAGIIKAGVPTLTAASGEALRVIEETVKNLNSPLFVIGRDFSISRNKNGKFNFDGRLWNFKDIELGLKGEYQTPNAGLALAALEVLSELGFPLEETAVREAFKNAKWPGRYETIGVGPKIILDGAHNPHASKALAQALKAESKIGKLFLVIGMLDDKDARSVMADLAPLADSLILTKSSSNRAFSTKDIESCLKGLVQEPPPMVEKVSKALDLALSKASSNDLICVTGSLTVVGEARSHLRRKGLLSA